MTTTTPVLRGVMNLASASTCFVRLYSDGVVQCTCGKDVGVYLRTRKHGVDEFPDDVCAHTRRTLRIVAGWHFEREKDGQRDFPVVVWRFGQRTECRWPDAQYPGVDILTRVFQSTLSGSGYGSWVNAQVIERVLMLCQKEGWAFVPEGTYAPVSQVFEARQAPANVPVRRQRVIDLDQDETA